MIVVGIDPGITGAVAIVSSEDEGREPVVLTPELFKHRNRNRISETWFKDTISSLPPSHYVVIEEQSPRPGEGSVGAFTSGWNTAVYYVAAKVHGSRIVWVQPLTWKKYFGLINADKEASRETAKELFPSLSGSLSAKAHHGRAEALLIAWWGKQTIK